MRTLTVLIFFLPTLAFSNETLHSEFRPQNSNKKSVKNQKVSTFTGYSFNLSYRIATDLMEPTSPATYYNALSFGASTKFKDWFSILAGLDFSYVAMGTSIPNEPDNPSLSDFYLGISRKNDLSQTFSLMTDLINTFPTSERSRNEGYQSILDFNLALRAKIYKDTYSLTNLLSFEHIFNMNEFSPTTEQYNPEWVIRYGLRNSLRFLKNFVFNFTANARAITFTDGSSLLNYGNTTSFVYEQGKFMVSLSYENGQDLPQGEIDLWFINQYRKMVSFRAAYVF